MVTSVDQKTSSFRILLVTNPRGVRVLLLMFFLVVLELPFCLVLVGRLSHLFSFCLLLLRDQHCFTSFNKKVAPLRIFQIGSWTSCWRLFKKMESSHWRSSRSLRNCDKRWSFLPWIWGQTRFQQPSADSTTKVQQPLDWGDDESFLFEFCRCVFVFLLLFASFEWSFKRGRELEEACSRTMAEVLSSGKCPWCLLSTGCSFSFTSVLFYASQGVLFNQWDLRSSVIHNTQNNNCMILLHLQ